MHTIRRADFMLVLDQLEFEGKESFPLESRVRSDFVDIFAPEEPGVSVLLPRSDALESWFYQIVVEVFRGRAFALARFGKRTDTELDMILYFPGVGMEG